MLHVKDVVVNEKVGARLSRGLVRRADEAPNTFLALHNIVSKRDFSRVERIDIASDDGGAEPVLLDDGLTVHLGNFGTTAEDVVPQPELCEPLARVLQSLGVRRAMVVCGSVNAEVLSPESKVQIPKSEDSSDCATTVLRRAPCLTVDCGLWTVDFPTHIPDKSH